MNRDSHEDRLNRLRLETMVILVLVVTVWALVEHGGPLYWFVDLMWNA